jgi:hypothetical protein
VTWNFMPRTNNGPVPGVRPETPGSPGRYVLLAEPHPSHGG